MFFGRPEPTVVYFGKLIFNKGVQLLLEGFLKHSPAPKPRVMSGIEISPEDPAFSGFIFKIQANMDPKHRDRIAFVRLCSGHFRRGMKFTHVRSNSVMSLNNPVSFFGQDRETTDEAFAGGPGGRFDLPATNTLTHRAASRPSSWS